MHLGENMPKLANFVGLQNYFFPGSLDLELFTNKISTLVLMVIAIKNLIHNEQNFIYISIGITKSQQEM